MWTENFRMARTSLRSSRLRSFLTMLGIIIGVVSVVTIFSLGEGVKRQLSRESKHLGNNLITIRPGKLVNRDKSGNITSVNLLSNFSVTSLNGKDLDVVSKTPHVKSFLPLSVVVGAPSYNDKNYDKSFVIGTTPNMPEVLKQKVEFGAFFAVEDHNKRTAVVGRDVAEKLFGEAVPIGKSMQIRGQEFIVQGIFEKFESNALNPAINFDSGVFIPYDTAKAISGGQSQIYEILVQVDSPDSVPETAGKLTESLKAAHEGQEDFTVLKNDETITASTTIINLITQLIALVAAISLFVGGIGIMNVMLVSVSERTREIGLRKAIGATNRQIRDQFMIEAILLSFWGAFIGVLLSFLTNFVIRITTDLQPIITWQVVLTATLVSMIVGLVFGMAPAIKASRKNPIDALRSM